ncbi:MAG TPA: discoidin domain-containing protein [Tepidisphaeraceae bacterium]|nr:discoidin domain-containing protein [Tepidisphaeraceae bacterium]
MRHAQLRYAASLIICFILAPVAAYAQPSGTHILPIHALAKDHFGNDAPWYEQNIPFFDCSDSELTQVYYYRWQLYKSHLRDLGDRGYIVTEFLNDVGWAKAPYQSLNDATAFHIHEGRWLKDSRYVNDYIDYMYTGGGNDRHFSEAIPDAVYSLYLVNRDRAFAIRHLDIMQHIFHLWDDHYDFSKNLYYIEPILDATEYSIASIDASGGKDGFLGGDAFRPTINSFMFANAVAISKIAALAGDTSTARAFAHTAASIKQSVEKNLWNDDMQHFVDRYHVNNRFVRYWNFVRGRELEGYVPWYFNLPANDPRFAASWRHLLSPDGFAGPYGLRTVEPSYEYYMRQYRYDLPTGKPECQWNGPSWPFDTTLVLGAMANLLNDYNQNIIHKEDYVRLLRQYAHQHYLNGKLDLQEDYNPDTGNVIVGLPRSDHYNHSDFVDLVISGLVGLRPRPDDVLEVNPLIPTDPNAPNSLSYFCLENVLYHGQLVTILYDSDGKHYGKGAGLSIYVDGEKALAPSPLGKKTVTIKPPPPPLKSQPAPINLAVNFRKSGFPVPSASINDAPAALYEAIDGRIWFYPNVKNDWSTSGSQAAQDWFALDFGRKISVRSVNLYFYGDGTHFKAPTDYSLEYWSNGAWAAIPGLQKTPNVPLDNGQNTVRFPPLETSRLRAVFHNPKDAATALVEIQVF